ncbi:MAG: hypothetical protein ABL882_10005 [Sphingopyxis sp.]
MAVRFPIYTYLKVDGFQMYPGTSDAPGICHEFTPGLHLVAGVNGLGKSTLLLILYHGLMGPAAIRNDDFGVAKPELVLRRDADRFRKRVADAAKDASAEVHFRIGNDHYEIIRSLHDLSLIGWKINGAEQLPDDKLYTTSVSTSMSVGSFADVAMILNLIVFMFEDRGLLMWSQHAQRNVLRSLFMPPDVANTFVDAAKAVSSANSAYRNKLYIANLDKKKLEKDRAALASADSLSVEYNTLQMGILAHSEALESLRDRRGLLTQSREDARTTFETAKWQYDEILREIEALKLARIASAFPKAEESSHYVLARLIGDEECLSCGADGGPLIEKWMKSVSSGCCLVCGADQHAQEAVVPLVAVDAARLTKAEARLKKARQSLANAEDSEKQLSAEFDQVQIEIDRLVAEKSANEKRVVQIAGSLPPSPPAVAELETRVKQQQEELARLRREQTDAEFEFSKVFEPFKNLVEQKADAIRHKFGNRISEFLVEKAEISLAHIRSPVGEGGQAYDWPTFQLSMTSGSFDSPSPRRNRTDVSMSQGEFIDLAFRLALIEVAAEEGPSSMVFDAPEASLDALFMRRAGAFLAEFAKDNAENRLIVTSNLTNADMIPALFGAYEPEEGDPQPQPIPREQRRSRVIDLLTLAAPTSAVALVRGRYRNMLDIALFPPSGSGKPGL